MALVLAEAAPLKPEVRLAQALHDYETILSDEDRIQLHSQGLPDAAAAINFTTLIDRDCSSRRSRCMGPRLITFLESIQQFSNVVDTFVSSHPEMAALVWGGVKLALLAANNFSSYFDQFSTFLMNLGKQCPRIRELGSLYPSIRLQTALCDYYAAIIRLCKHSTQSLRRPVYAQLSKALFVSFKAEFRPYEEEVTRLSQEVRDEASLASKQAQKQENELQASERFDARRYREIMFKFSDNYYKSKEDEKKGRLETIRRNLEKMRFKALNALSTYDYQKSYRQIRKECMPGTSTWIYETLEFHAWMSGTLKTLWFTGRLGSGKSVTSACVTAHLIEKVSPTDVTAFFFCRFDESESLKAKTIIGSVIRQLVSDLPVNEFRAFNQESTNETNIISFLEATLSRNRQYFIMLDGLDECGETQVKEVADIFHKLLLFPRLRIKLFWSSRPNVPSWLPGRFLAQQHIDLETAENQSRVACDIRKFIHVTLEGWLEGETPELQINDPTLIITILDCLEKEAQGMFLWVKLQLQTLREKKSDNLILTALRHLPPDLPKTFERILSKHIEFDDIDIARQIFRWVLVAKRPLTVEELREAIGTKPLQEVWSDTMYINDMKKAVACCSNLIFIEEEQQTIHFTHGSVKQHLLSGAVQESRSRYYVDPKEADEDAGAICVTYLSFPAFNGQLARKTGRSISTTDITSTVVKNSLPFRKPANDFALSLLRLRRSDKSSKSVSRLLENADGDVEAYRQHKALQQYSFQHYAKRFWLEHTQRIDSNSKKLWRLWCNLIEEADWRDTLSGISWTSEDWKKRAPNVVQWIVEQDHCSLAQLIIGSDERLTQENLLLLVRGAAIKGCAELIEIGLGPKDTSQPILDSGLQSAARGGHLDIVERLLRRKADVNAAAGDDFHERTARTALQAAAENGPLNVVRKLIQHKAYVNGAVSPGNSGRTALQAAAENGHLDVVETLIQHKANVNAGAGAGSYRRTALQAAAENGHLDVVEILIQHKANVNAAASGEDYGRTALQAAAENGHLDVVEILIQHKANVNAAASGEDYGRTALQAAAEHGHLNVVERLLQEKIDVNAVDKYGRTALQMAAKDGHLDVVERLLQEKVDVNAVDKWGMTAFQMAAGKGRLDVVERLLQEKIDFPVVNKLYGTTALHMAAKSGHLDVVERLLQEEIDINATDLYGMTAFQMAAKNGHLDVVERLLQEKIDPHVVNKLDGRTALHMAAENGHLDVVKILRVAGAKK